jgi:hypothetical protein
MIQQPEVDSASPLGIGHTNGVEHLRTLPPGQPPGLPLQVFISYKEQDKATAVRIKQQLMKIGGHNIRVFVAADEPPGKQWRELILDNLRKAHLLIFLYTDPEKHWDWCLYETGYFDAKLDPTELDRRLYVLHRRGDPPSGPFLGLNTVPIDTSYDSSENRPLKAFLQVVFEQATSPAVNPHWDAGGCTDLVEAFTAPFRPAVAPAREYVRRLTFRLKTGSATQAALHAGRIPADTIVSGNQKSFELFGFGIPEERPWEALEKQWRSKILPPNEGLDPDPIALWVESLAQKMLAAMNGEHFDDGLPAFFCPFIEQKAEALFRPSLARLVQYHDAYEFEVVFVDIPAELGAGSKGPLTTVGILLRLAHMFRFGLIEPTAREVVERPAAAIPAVAREMERRLHSITAEAFIRGIRTEQATLLAFQEGSALQTEVKQSMEWWKNTVAPALAQAIAGEDTHGFLEALKAASKVNWQFHRACAQRYLELVEKHCQEGSGPLDAV